MNEELSTEVSSWRCRLCDGQVERFLDLGQQPISNTYPLDSGQRETTFALVVGLCGTCAMVQQNHNVPASSMFTPDYPFRTTSSRRSAEHFGEVASEVLNVIDKVDPLVVEIGSNDGAFLSEVARRSVRHLGVDPATEASAQAAERGVRTVTDFFDARSARLIRNTEGPASVIFSANAISHIRELPEVLRGVSGLLDDDGFLIFEERYIGEIIHRNAFDQFYDEHYYVFGVTSVDRVLNYYGLELVHAERTASHGGSILYWATHRGRTQPSASIDRLRREEDASELDQLSTYGRFADRVWSICHELRSQLEGLQRSGLEVVGYGATSRSATVLQAAGIGSELIPRVVDNTPGKVGRYLPGSKIPILSTADMPTIAPDVIVLFAWNHAQEILKKESHHTSRGCRWLTYCPTVEFLEPAL